MGPPIVASADPSTADEIVDYASLPMIASFGALMGSLVKKRRKRMRKKKHKKMLKRTRFQRRAQGK
jgi:hypothetical protein